MTDQLDLLAWSKTQQQPAELTMSTLPRHQRARRRWLADQIGAGALSRRAVEDALRIDPPDLDRIIAGRATLAYHAWRRLARLAKAGEYAPMLQDAPQHDIANIPKHGR
jgi:hypothetical protein